MNNVDLNFLTKHKQLFQGKNICVGGLDVNGKINHIVDVAMSIDIRDGEDVNIVMDACEMIEMFGPDSFDNVICMNTLEHMEKWDTCMHNMYRCLKIGGHMLITVPTTDKKRHNYPNDYWRFTMRQLKGMFVHDKVISTMAEPGRSRHGIIKWLGIIIEKSGGCIHLDWTPAKVEGGHLTTAELVEKMKNVKGATICMPPMIGTTRRKK